MDEMDRLQFDREREVARLVPRPTCCEAAKNYPAVTFQVADVEGKRPTRGYWHAHMSEPLARRSAIGPDGSVWLSAMPVAKFCPFCGTALPKMVLKDPIPKTVCVVLDGGYYCSTCKDRLSSCLCDPQASAFEPKR
jgi:hypothetical protein